jgi:hypothetical protein
MVITADEPAEVRQLLISRANQHINQVKNPQNELLLSWGKNNWLSRAKILFQSSGGVR